MPASINTFIEKDENKIKILQNLSLRTIKIFFASVFIFWLVISQFIMIQSSFLMKYIYSKVGLSTTIIGYMEKSANIYKSMFYPFTGLSQHAVFMDYHFQGYNRVVAIAYKENGKRFFLPIINEKGQASWYDSGRQWVNYSFRVSNKEFDIEQYENGIKKYIYFWAFKNGIDLNNSSFDILYKYNKVPYSWEKNLLKNNLQTPWQDMATIGWKKGVFYSNLIVDNIDFMEEKLPIFINTTSGISDYEEEFRWSNGEKSEIIFKSNLPNKFKLSIDGIPFESSINTHMKIIIGDVVKDVILKKDYTNYSLEFNNVNSNKIIFEHQNPKSPQELGISSDTRKLSFAFYKIKFEETSIEKE